MKNKVLLYSLLLISLFIVGCDKKEDVKDSKENSSEIKEEINDENQIEGLNKSKEVVIPDVTNLTLNEAKIILENLGLKIDDKIIEQEDETIKEGNIIKTNPQKGRTVKAGTTIKLYKSIGKSAGYIVENFIGKNYLEVKSILETKGILVIVEKQDVTSNYSSNQIINQSVKAGTTLKKGDTIILYIPNEIAYYPDFIGYNEKEILNFCNAYQLVCNITFLESSEHESGYVIS